MIFKDHPMRYIICTHIFAISIVLYTLHTVYSMSHISIYISTICTICSIFVWGLHCMFRKSRQWKQLWNHLRSRQSVWCRCFLAWLKMDDAGVQLARLARSTKKCLNIFLFFTTCAGVDDGMIALLLMALRMYPTSGYKYIREPPAEMCCAVAFSLHWYLSPSVVGVFFQLLLSCFGRRDMYSRTCDRDIWSW